MLTDRRNITNHAMTDNDLALLDDAMKQLRNIAARLRKRYEANCNGILPEDELDYNGNDMKADKLQLQADAIAHNVGLYTYHQTDPRGCSLYVSFAPIPDNAYDCAVALY
jgi:hypothetical protein